MPVYDFAEHDGQPYLVMKYIDEETLKERMQESPIASEEGLRIVDAVGSALSFAHHKEGVLHRDVKPSNVVLDADGDVYLADFGIARIAQSGESTISQDVMLGTPHYIYPEQAKGMRELGPETDIYSFGVMLYELVVGRVPFLADTPFSIIHDHIYTPLPSPRELNPNVPEAVEQVLFRALAKEPADRYSDASELVSEFHRASSGELPSTATAQGAFDVSPRVGTVDAVAAQTIVAAEADKTPNDLHAAAAGTTQGSTITVAEKRPQRRLLWVALGALLLVILLWAGPLGVWQLTKLAAIDEPIDAVPTAPAPSVDVSTPVQPTPIVDNLPVIPNLHIPDDIDAVAKRRIEEAYELLTKDPSDPLLYINLFGEFLAAGLSEQAAAVLEEGAAIANYVPEYFLEASDKALALVQSLATLFILEQGLLHNNESQLLLIKASPLLAGTVRQDGALEIYESYQVNLPDWIAPKVATVRWYINHNHLPEAEVLIRDLIAGYPDDPEIRSAYGEYFSAAGESEAAIEQFQYVIGTEGASALLRRKAEQ